MLQNWGEEGKICYKLSWPKGLRCTYCSSNLCNRYFILRPLVLIASQSHSPSSNLMLGPYRSPIKSCLLPLERHSQQHRRDDNKALVEVRRGAHKAILWASIVVVSLVRRCLVWGIRRRSKIDFYSRCFAAFEVFLQQGADD